MSLCGGIRLHGVINNMFLSGTFTADSGESPFLGGIILFAGRRGITPAVGLFGGEEM